MEPIIPQDPTLGHLGGNIPNGDISSFCPKAWDYVIDRFCIESVHDLGSGEGYSALYFHRRGLKVLATDGLPQNVQRAFYPTICHDLKQGPVKTSVDLVHCQEVVEHIEEQYLENLLSSLATGRIVLMTHAIPGQGGYHHVNEQPEQYWIKHMERYGYKPLWDDITTVRQLAAEENGKRYMAKTDLVFARNMG